MKADQVTNGAGDAVWDRLPSRGKYNGASRAYWYQQINAGTIRSASIKKPGQQRGMRLVWRPSVLAFIERYAVEGT